MLLLFLFDSERKKKIDTLEDKKVIAKMKIFGSNEIKVQVSLEALSWFGELFGMRKT